MKTKTTKNKTTGRKKPTNYAHFTEAHREWKGVPWKWEKENGEINHPIDADNVTAAFYLGHYFGKKSAQNFRDKIAKLENLIAMQKYDLDSIKKQLKEFLK